MIDDKRKKNRVSDFEIEGDEKEVDTMDIYDDDQRNEMLKTDEITAAENGFIQGREMKPKEIKKTKTPPHEDSVSVELAKEEYAED